MAANAGTLSRGRKLSPHRVSIVAVIAILIVGGLGLRAFSTAGSVEKGEVVIASGIHDKVSWQLFGMRNGSQICLDLRHEPAQGGACAISTPFSAPLQVMPGSSAEFSDAYVAGAVTNEITDVDVDLDNGSYLRAEIFENSRLGAEGRYFLAFVPYGVGGTVLAHDVDGTVIDTSKFTELKDLRR